MPNSFYLLFVRSRNKSPFFGLFNMKCRVTKEGKQKKTPRYTMSSSTSRVYNHSVLLFYFFASFVNTTLPTSLTDIRNLEGSNF